MATLTPSGRSSSGCPAGGISPAIFHDPAEPERLYSYQFTVVKPRIYGILSLDPATGPDRCADQAALLPAARDLLEPGYYT